LPVKWLVTVSSVLRVVGLTVAATPKGVMEVTMAGREGSATSAEVVLGVDTHLDLHVAVALDQLGRRLGALTVPTTAMGYKSLVSWAEGFGPVRCAGVEGTGSYGAGLARHFKTAGIPVMEVERPKRRHLRRNGKSDPLDAEAAARTVLAGETAGEPKSADGRVEMIRALRTARHSAVKARSQATNQLQALVVTAPETLRKRLRGLSTRELVAVAARFCLGSDPADVQTATRFALRSVARHQQLSEEIAKLDEQLDRLVAEAAPDLVCLPAIGASHAATLLIVAGDNSQRLSSEASFASLCGASPIEASSGKVVRHRLNRGGDREANRALHLICVARMARDQRTREYVSRRTAEGKSKREIMRCLKRYIAREVYRVLASTAAGSPPTASSPGAL
jgi:transposase